MIFQVIGKVRLGAAKGGGRERLSHDGHGRRSCGSGS